MKQLYHSVKPVLVIGLFMFCSGLAAQSYCVTLQPDANNDYDTYIGQAGPIFADYQYLPTIVGNGGFGGNYEIRSLLRFNLSPIPAGAVIQSATLYLYADTSSVYGPNPQTGTNSCYLKRITSAWSDTVV